ncbi:MAG: hypothetical protein Q7S40_34085 [Opitutaceae bacterium]|nr:hypothetical protein [Opitutaceae bacterium]
MKKMTALLVVITALALCALLILRHQRRGEPTLDPRPTVPAASTAAQPPKAAQPMDAFQAGVKLDTRTGTAPDADAKRRLMERLQREEERQEPRNQRN